MASSGSKGAYGFDPSGLERAAKAAKELDSSANAKNAFELSVKQEEVKKIEVEGHLKQLEIQRTQIDHQERRKTLDKEFEVSKQKSLFDDQLAKERYKKQLEDHARMQELNRQKDEESVAKQEQLRRQTLEYEHQLKVDGDKRKMLAREEAKINRIKNTKDIRHEEIRLKESERRETLKQVWKTNMEVVGNGLSGFFGDFRNLANVAGGLTLAFFGFHFAKAAGRLATSYVEAHLGKPSLIRETSRKTSVKELLKSPFTSLYEQILIRGRFRPTTSVQREKDILDGIFINPELELNLKTLAHSIVNRKAHYAPFRNLLLYGPPGTGKTMFAKSLAKHSGMDYAIMTGGDIGPLGKDGVTELHKLFDWASTSKKGVLVFMDESDAFLRKRTTEKIGEDMRNSLNALLYRTGSASHKFMLVLASNTPDQLDRAIHDRIDEIVQFDRPAEKQRVQMLYHYLLEYCSPSLTFKKKLNNFFKNPSLSVFKRTEIGMSGVDDEFIEKIAKKIEGFSGREIYKLVIAWHDAAFNKQNAILTPDLMESVLDSHINQHKQREEWHKLD